MFLVWPARYSHFTLYTSVVFSFNKRVLKGLTENIFIKESSVVERNRGLARVLFHSYEIHQSSFWVRNEVGNGRKKRRYSESWSHLVRVLKAVIMSLHLIWKMIYKVQMLIALVRWVVVRTELHNAYKAFRRVTHSKCSVLAIMIE